MKYSFPLILAAVLALLFWKSFVPGYVHFSNDGPLGQQAASYIQPPQSYSGMWGDLNGTGAGGMAAPPDIKVLFYRPQLLVGLYIIWAVLYTAIQFLPPKSKCFLTLKRSPKIFAFVGMSCGYSLFVLVHMLLCGITPVELWYACVGVMFLFPLGIVLMPVESRC